MKKIDINQFIKAVQDRAELLNKFTCASNLSATERAICEANVFFLNKIIDELNSSKTMRDFENFINTNSPKI